MAVVKGCRKPKETMNALSAMLGCTSVALIKEPIDFLGPVFASLAADKWMGQFFTPYHVSRMMAEMTIGDRGEMLKDRPYFTLSEPACGAGGMVLAANMVLRDRGFDVSREAHWHMQDVDHRAVCAAYLQAALTDASALVVCGNSLSMERRHASLTPAAVLYPKTFRATQVESPPPAPPPAVGPEQLSLF